MYIYICVYTGTLLLLKFMTLVYISTPLINTSTSLSLSLSLCLPLYLAIYIYSPQPLNHHNKNIQKSVLAQDYIPKK